MISAHGVTEAAYSTAKVIWIGVGYLTGLKVIWDG
jgi:hypothetical protein